jgi:DNA-directed RNA polymerase specialized sigma24 family protein
MRQATEKNEGDHKFRLIVEKSYIRLVTFKKDSDQKSFNTEMLKILPEINRYVSNRLTTAVMSGKLNKDMFSPNDFTDQLFIEVYDHLDEIKNDNELYPFLFTKVDELLEDSLTEEEFDHVFFDHIDTYSKPEWDAMEEKYSRDGDGDFVMLEELDDSSYPKNNYTLNHVFITDDEKKLVKKLDASLNEDRIERHIQLVLHKMTLPMRTTFQLYSDQGFSTKEIANIRKTSLEEIEDLLAQARKILKESFSKRFLVASN